MTLRGSAGRYVDATAAPPVDRLLVRPVAAGELLPAAAVVADDAATTSRTVSVPVTAGHVPGDLARGELVDVYVTPDRSGANAAAVRVATSAVVADVEADRARFGASGSTTSVLLTVDAEAVARLVGGVAGGPVDVVRVPLGATTDAP